MSVKINVRHFLPHLTNDQDVVEVEGSTIGQCFENLVARFPKVKRWLFGKDGKLSNFIDIFVNLESVPPDELTKPVKDGDEIHIVMRISGG
jgi:molybdopterin converting factor small subunit